jgi:hypothetical protein
MFTSNFEKLVSKTLTGEAIEQNKNSDNRMVFKQGNSTDTIWSLGSSFDRSICLDSQSSDTNILFMDASHRSSSIRCSNNFMGEDVCLFPFLHDAESSDLACLEKPFAWKLLLIEAKQSD